MVVVNLYPFVKAAQNPETSFESLIEEIDIGGPSLVRAAAKNFADVIVVVSPSDYAHVLEALDRPGGPSPSFRFDLARKAFAHTARYDSAIASTLSSVKVDDAGFTRVAASGFPDSLTVNLRKVRDLRYGENPHQHAALYSGFGAASRATRSCKARSCRIPTCSISMPLSAWCIEFKEPAAALIKHTNPCGAATGSSAADAYVRAREADSVSAFGAAVALNRSIDVETARAIVSTRIDAVIAPAVDDDARAILATKANMRVVVPERVAADTDAPSSAEDLEIRSIVGGVLVQSRDTRRRKGSEPWPTADLQVVTKRQPTADEWQAMRFAWRLCAHVKSNTVIFTSADRTLAIGAGQMSRVDSVNVARMKAARDSPDLLVGSVAASDAFIPFRDGLDAIAARVQQPLFRPAGRSRTKRSSPRPTNTASRWCSRADRHFRH